MLFQIDSRLLAYQRAHPDPGGLVILVGCKTLSETTLEYFDWPKLALKLIEMLSASTMALNIDIARSPFFPFYLELRQIHFSNPAERSLDWEPTRFISALDRCFKSAKVFRASKGVKLLMSSASNVSRNQDASTVGFTSSAVGNITS